jgi:hypothetical protein
VHGPLIAALTGSGELMVKEGSLTAKWNHEHSDVEQIAVASDPVKGPLIGIIADAEAMVKEGSLTAKWNHEHSDAFEISVAG